MRPGVRRDDVEGFVLTRTAAFRTPRPPARCARNSGTRTEFGLAPGFDRSWPVRRIRNMSPNSSPLDILYSFTARAHRNGDQNLTLRLNNKVAVITGAALGLGRASALRMAAEGAAIAVLDLLDREGQALVDEIIVLGGKARYWRCDVSQEADVARVMAEGRRALWADRRAGEQRRDRRRQQTHPRDHRGRVGPGAGGQCEGRVQSWPQDFEQDDR